MITITPDTNVFEELVAEYHETKALVERFNDPWSSEAARTLRFMIRLLEEAQSSAI